MKIRPALPRDIAGISHLVDKHAQRGDVLPRSESQIRATLSEWIVGTDAGKIAACASLLIYTPELAEVRSLIVDDRIKGQGWGATLLQMLIARARRRGTPILFALTRAEAFFKQAGFAVTDRDRFPEKIWRDCDQCPVKDNCDEVAVELRIDDLPHLVQTRDADD